MKILMIVYAVWNIAVFLIYGADKRRAVKGAWRIPERVLLSCAFFMGGAGAFLGMQIFRHKTKHLSFKILVPFFLLLNVAALCLLPYLL